jgi:flagellar biosynthesis/type III secretory pathway chaperone
MNKSEKCETCHQTMTLLCKESNRLIQVKDEWEEIASWTFECKNCNSKTKKITDNATEWEQEFFELLLLPS